MEALLDTGAARTCVTAEVAQKAGLKVMGRTPINSVQGTQVTNFYLADVLLFFDVREDDDTEAIRGQFSTKIEIVEFVANTPHFGLSLEEMCFAPATFK